MILLALIDGFPLWYRMALVGIPMLCFAMTAFNLGAILRKLLKKKITLKYKTASGEISEDRRK